MSIFESLGKQTAPQMQNPQQMLQQLRNNPVTTLKQAGFNIPDDMNNPGQIIDYLLQSGQVTNTRLQMAQRILGRR